MHFNKHTFVSAQINVAHGERRETKAQNVATLANECMISDRTSESGSVPMALMRASHMKCHIWVRYSGPRTRAHSSSRGMDSAAATRTRETVKANVSCIFT